MTRRWSPFRVVSILAVFGILFPPADAGAQVAVGTLLGNVTDESGGAVPGATITATEVRTSISRTTVSNEAGRYTFTNTPPGVYRVEGELVGFRKFARENVEVSVNTTVRVDIALSVGALEESVMVTGEAPVLQTDRTDTGRIIESAQITQMPLGFNRNFQALLITVPGASRPFRPHSEFYNSQDSLSTNVNGQGRQSNNVQLEGADNSDNGGNLAFMIPLQRAATEVTAQIHNTARARRRRTRIRQILNQVSIAVIHHRAQSIVVRKRALVRRACLHVSDRLARVHCDCVAASLARIFL